MAESGSVKRFAGTRRLKVLSSASVLLLKPAATVGFNSGASLTLATVTIVVT